MDRASATTAQLDEIAEALPQRAATLSRLFLKRSSIQISRVEALVLNALAQQPRRITELAAREAVSQPGITLLVDRLQERGWSRAVRIQATVARCWSRSRPPARRC